MTRVRCNFCDARASTSARIDHAPGCPFRKNMQRCKECGQLGKHTPRCPFVKAKESR